MKKSLYFECEAGISGDMTVAALLDLGASETYLRKQLQGLFIDGYEIEITNGISCGITAKRFLVKLTDTNEQAHTHQLDHVHTHTHTHIQEHQLEHVHNHLNRHSIDDVSAHAHHHNNYDHHDHSHNNEHSHHKHNHTHELTQHSSHDHIHRTYADIKKIIEASTLTDKEKEMSIQMFEHLAIAEGRVHGKPKEEVHFHEVGAIDSIVDICSTAICMSNLGYDEIIIRYVADGFGQINCAHGQMPVPVPATLELLTQHKIPLKSKQVETELVTPTGATILSTYGKKRTLPNLYTIVRHGNGMGTKQFNFPNILRVLEIEYDSK